MRIKERFSVLFPTQKDASRLLVTVLVSGMWMNVIAVMHITNINLTKIGDPDWYVTFDQYLITTWMIHILMWVASLFVIYWTCVINEE